MGNDFSTLVRVVKRLRKKGGGKVNAWGRSLWFKFITSVEPSRKEIAFCV